MLSELSIKQLGVIEAATFCPGPGLTVVTGETGAGKTLVVSGLGLVAGLRADSAVVRNHQGNAVIEARFTGLTPQCEARLEDSGAVLEDGELLITRQVSAAGRSRSWVGGASVTLAVAHLIGTELVTIHGQSEQVRLSTPERQRQVLDRSAGPAMARQLQMYRDLFDERKTVAQQWQALSTTASERARDADMLRFGLSEIERINPEPAEDVILQQEAKRLQDSDDLRARAWMAMAALAGDDQDTDSMPALTTISMAVKALGEVTNQDPKALPLLDQAKELSALTTDLAGATASYLADLNADPVRLEWIEFRLAELKTLTRKYGPDVDAVLVWADSAGTRLAEHDNSAEQILTLRQRLTGLDMELARLAEQITKSRIEAAARFQAQITKELAALAMPDARLEFEISALAELGPWGGDAVSLLFTANPGSEPAPLGKVASGGELSRLRLAIEVVLADNGSQTFVFDEVDAGISGAVGLQVGLRLARLSKHGQVIVVTHLAQVAAFADTHFVVVKSNDGEVTAAGLNQVEDQTRLAELARMMSGLDQTKSSLAHANELVEQAGAMRAIADF